MTNLLEIIKQKGVGEYLGLCESNSEKIENYPQYVQMSASLEQDRKYFVEVFSQPNFLSYYKQLYLGYDKKTADEKFDKAVEDNRIKVKSKENKFEELSKN